MFIQRPAWYKQTEKQAEMIQLNHSANKFTNEM
jgi:hypothetical protein